jgi:cytoskeletal protein CcmA (bactofilin family)
MFGTNSKNENSQMNSLQTETLGSNSINSLGSGTKITGDVQANSDIRIDGELEGTLRCSGKVILGPKGLIKGEVDCQSAVIEGTLTGTLKVKELLHVKESASITGEIQTSKLMVQSGAVFNVKCQMGGQKIAPKAITAVKSA